MTSFFSKQPDGLRIYVKVQPGASKNAVEEVISDPQGQHYIRLRVTAPPEKGKANIAVAEMLAEAWDIPISTISLVARETSRFKVFHIRGNPDLLEAHLHQWLRTHAPKR
jgi:uncharacterized protein